jgi:mono/diheme cytochrome c family protein
MSHSAKSIRTLSIMAFAAGVLLACIHPPEARAQAAKDDDDKPTVAAKTPEIPGSDSYSKHCAICHGELREGILPGFPPLAGIQHQMKDAQILELIRKGKGRMPGFPALKDDELAGLMKFLATSPAVAPVTSGLPGDKHGRTQLTGAAAAGGALFLQNCAFCHGRDAMGGETGPDLTQSKLVLGDKDGSKIIEVTREGRIEKKMPAFNFSTSEAQSLVAFIRARVTAAAAMGGNRRGVDVADLQTGNAQSGKAFFDANCARCHSPTGDLAGIAKRYEGLRLEQRMLYPEYTSIKVIVTLPNGKKIAGTLAYQDEFTIGLRDQDWAYHSWRTDSVKFTIDEPVEAHVELFPKYTDDDVHNLMAYLQTLH